MFIPGGGSRGASRTSPTPTTTGLSMSLIKNPGILIKNRATVCGVELPESWSAKICGQAYEDSNENTSVIEIRKNIFVLIWFDPE